MSLSAAQNIEVDHLFFQYNSAAYDGNFIDLDSFGAANDGVLIDIHHCGIGGSSTVIDNAVRLINLRATYNIDIHHCMFVFGQIGVGCSGTSNSVVSVHDNLFEKNVATCISGRSGSWSLFNNTQQCDSTNGVALTTFFALAGELNGLRISGNLLGVDGGVGAGGGIILDLTGQICTGIEISGNLSGVTTSGTFLSCSTTAGSTSGLSVHGNRLTGFDTIFNLGRATAIVITGNHLNPTTTLWTGTEPTNYYINNNHTNASTAQGIAVANDANIAITLPGSAANGMKWITISEVLVDGASAMYILNGGAGTTTEVSDPGGLFTNAVGGVASYNVYWDAGTVSYRLENKRGGSRTVVVNVFGGR